MAACRERFVRIRTLILGAGFGFYLSLATLDLKLRLRRERLEHATAIMRYLYCLRQNIGQGYSTLILV